MESRKKRMLTLALIALAIVGTVGAAAVYLGWFQRSLTGSVEVKGIEAITILPVGSSPGYEFFGDYVDQIETEVLYSANGASNGFVLSITNQNLLPIDIGENVAMLVDLTLMIDETPVELTVFDITMTGTYLQYKLGIGDLPEIRANNDLIPPSISFDVAVDGTTVTYLELDRILYETPEAGQPTNEGNAVRFNIVIDQFEPLPDYGPDNTISVEVSITLGTET